MRAPDRKSIYTSDCVPTAIAAWTGQLVEDVLSAKNLFILTRGCPNQIVYKLVKQSGFPFQYTLWNGKLKNLPLKFAGLAWCYTLDGKNLHLVAFDGKLIVDNNVNRVTWVYDHVCAKCKVFALFLLPDTWKSARVPKHPHKTTETKRPRKTTKKKRP
jgi:hypothetical protein